MPPPRKVSPEARALAVDEVRKGATTREVAAALGRAGVKVSHVSVAAWVKAAPPAPPPHPPAAPPPEGEPPMGDSFAEVRAAIAAFHVQAREARAAGHHAAAVAASSHAAKLLPVLARLEKLERADADRVAYSQAEIDKAVAGVEARIRAYLARPLLCAHCGRALSAEWGGVDPATLAAHGQPDHSVSPDAPRGS